MALRLYQQKAVDMLWQWFRDGNKGHPLIILPTGAGKSHVIAAICQQAINAWPDTRILKLTHVKELIEQNAEKILQHWPTAPLGIYSAGIGRRDTDSQILFAGIQSVRNRAKKIGRFDLIIIDEAHLVHHRNEGGYRVLINDLAKMNPSIRVIGLTATPWRLGHGNICENGALFSGPPIEPAGIISLVNDKYLSVLRSKITDEKQDTAGVKKKGGEFIESELQKKLDNADQTKAIVAEIIRRAEWRKSWLLFCIGVEHSRHVADELRRQGVVAECVTGKTPAQERERILEAFKNGSIQAVTNANVLTTGFDAPNIDLIAMLRPTMSPTLYVQMAGRGLRLKEHTDHCLVLDFAGNVQLHGPITSVLPPNSAQQQQPKICPECKEICPRCAKECPSCGTVLILDEPKPESENKDHEIYLRNDDIMGIEEQKPTPMLVRSWDWRRKISRAGNNMIVVSYYPDDISKPVMRDYLLLTSGDRLIPRAARRAAGLFAGAGVDDLTAKGSQSIIDAMQSAAPPSLIYFKRQQNNRKFFEVTDVIWYKQGVTA